MTRRRDDRGNVTFWTLGLCLCLLLLAGLTLDLWRVFGVRQRLAEAADAAATAGATALDEGALRRDGVYLLDPRASERRALDHLASEDDASLVTDASAAATPERVTVRVRGTVEFGLLRIFMRGDPFEITVTSSADPVRGGP
jgi:Flp pilus assembly protein TadG